MFVYYWLVVGILLCLYSHYDYLVFFFFGLYEELLSIEYELTSSGYLRVLISTFGLLGISFGLPVFILFYTPELKQYAKRLLYVSWHYVSLYIISYIDYIRYDMIVSFQTWTDTSATVPIKFTVSFSGDLVIFVSILFVGWMLFIVFYYFYPLFYKNWKSRFFNFWLFIGRFGIIIFFFYNFVMMVFLEVCFFCALCPRFNNALGKRGKKV
jgi:hypothetical protein